MANDAVPPPWWDPPSLGYCPPAQKEARITAAGTSSTCHSFIRRAYSLDSTRVPVLYDAAVRRLAVRGAFETVSTII